MDKNKYNRAAKDASQLQQFVDDTVEAINNDAYVESGQLHIAEVKASSQEPLITIDGIPYYHKHEFDVDAILADDAEFYDMLTGEVVDESYSTITQSRFQKTTVGPPVACIKLLNKTGSNLMVAVADNSYGITCEYSSQAYNVVKSLAAVQTTDDVYLKGISAYYGFISEDKKTFISYYNLENDIMPQVNAITDGETTLPIHDERIANTSSEDVDKVLAVESDGSLAFKSLSYTKLYKHTLYNASQGYSFTVITTTDEDLTQIFVAANIPAIISGQFSIGGAETASRIYLSTGTDAIGAGTTCYLAFTFYKLATDESWSISTRNGELTDTVTPV